MTELWEQALGQLRDRLSGENFDTWLAPVRCDGVENGSVVLRIPNRFFQDWISSNYLDLILEVLHEHSGSDELQVRWVVDEDLQPRPARPEPAAPPPAPAAQPSLHAGTATAAAPRTGTGGKSPDLNPKYLFHNFVVGPSNQLAHAASVAVGSDPGTRYNPLFIYGGVGLGKTHLVNAIGHRVVTDRPGARILYLSAERFTNEFIWALQNHRISEFRERYRTRCDVLLMDDIQFLAGREQTQEEFFHTFNALYHSDRQIVVTSDVYPQQIAEMEERLISRFQSGMVADIQPPELDTRIAILQKKAEQEKIALTGEVALFVAQVVKSNVRELEGTLLRLAVKAELVGRPIDLDLAKESLRAILPPPDHATTVEDIQRAVCDYFNIRLADLKSHRRHRAISFPRMVAMYLCRQRLGTSYPELGDRFGGKDHTTVMSAVRKIGGLLEREDEGTRTAVEAIERKLGVS
jgi:chromosomal replication initiator protein